MLSLGCMSFCCEQKGITSVCLYFHYHHQVGEVAQTKPSHRDRDGVMYLENEGRIETENRLVDFDWCRKISITMQYKKGTHTHTERDRQRNSFCGTCINKKKGLTNFHNFAFGYVGPMYTANMVHVFIQFEFIPEM